MWRKTANKNRQVYTNYHPKALEKYSGKKTTCIGPQLNGAVNLVTKEIVKTVIFNATFALTTFDRPWGQWQSLKQGRFTLGGTGSVREHLNKLDIQKSMGLDGTRSQMLSELFAVIVRRLLIIFKRSQCSGKAREGWKNANVNPVFRKVKEDDPGRQRPNTVSS